MPHILQTSYTPKTVLMPPDFTSTGNANLLWLDASDNSNTIVINGNQVSSWVNKASSPIIKFNAGTPANVTLVPNQAGPGNTLPLISFNSTGANFVATFKPFQEIILNNLSIFMVIVDALTTMQSYFLIQDFFTFPSQTFTTILFKQFTASTYGFNHTNAAGSGTVNTNFLNLYRNITNVSVSTNINPINSSLMAIGGAMGNLGALLDGRTPQIGGGATTTCQINLIQSSSSIGEVLWYFGDLTTIQILQVQNYLMTKWGIAGP